jgi:disulfide oxidoreductase YuzD
LKQIVGIILIENTKALHALHALKMTSYSKKFISTFLRDSIHMRYMIHPLKVTEIQMKPYDTQTAITINPYTIEEEVLIYPVVIVHNMPICQDVTIKCSE